MMGVLGENVRYKPGKKSPFYDCKIGQISHLLDLLARFHVRQKLAAIERA